MQKMARPPTSSMLFQITSHLGVRIRGTLEDIEPSQYGPFFREPEVGFRRVPFKGSP